MKSRRNRDAKKLTCATTILININPELLPHTTSYISRKLQEIPGLLQAAAEADYKRLRHYGHALKGSGGAYGLPQLSIIGAKIETAAISSDLKTAREQILEMETFLRSVRLE